MNDLHDRLFFRDGKFLVDILMYLDNKNIPYCLTHDYEKIPDEINSDVDIIIPEPYLSKLPEILNQYGLIQCIQHETTAYYYIFVQNPEKSMKSILHLDASSDFRRDGIKVLSTADFLSSKKMNDKNLWIPSSDVEFIYTLIKRIGKGSLNQSQAEKINRLYLKNSILCEQRLSNFFPKEQEKEIINAITSLDWSCIDLSEMKKCLIKYVKKSKPSDTIVYSLGDLSRRMWRVFNPTGIFVMFLGPDGCGKTSVIDHISEDLAPLFRRVECHHFRPQVLWKAKLSDLTQIQNPHSKKNYPIIVSWFKTIAVYLDWLLGYLGKIMPARIKSSFVIYDRGFFDLYLDPKRYRLASFTSFTKILSIFLPKPDLLFYLDTPPDILLNRKHEIPMGELIELRKVYQEEFSDCKMNTYKIDASKPLEDVVNEIEKIIINYLTIRTSMRFKK